MPGLSTISILIFYILIENTYIISRLRNWAKKNLEQIGVTSVRAGE